MAPPRSILMYASEVAACIGDAYYDKNGYKTTLEKWERDAPESLRDARRRNKLSIKSNDERCKKFLANEKIASEVDSLILSGWSTVKDLDTRITKIITPVVVEPVEPVVGPVVGPVVEPVVEPIEPSVLFAYIKKEIYTTTGKRDEKSIIDEYEVKNKVLVKERNSKVYYKSIGDGVRIAGRVDGMNELGEIIEVKKRMHRLFKDVPKYEMVQMYIYMFLLNKPDCVHIQKYNQKSVETEITMDYVYLEYIFEKIKDYSVFYKDLLRNHASQDSFLNKIECS